MTVGVNERYPAYKAKSELRNRQRRADEQRMLKEIEERKKRERDNDSGNPERY